MPMTDGPISIPVNCQLIHIHPSYHMNFLLTLNTIEHPFPINTVKLSITRLYLLFSDVGVSTFYKNPNHMYLDQVMWLCVMISHDRYFINIINFMKMCDRVTFVVKVLSLLHMASTQLRERGMRHGFEAH